MPPARAHKSMTAFNKKRLLLASGRSNQTNGAVQRQWRSAIGTRQHGDAEWAIRQCGSDVKCALRESMTELAWSGRRVGSAARWQVRTPTSDGRTGAHAVVPPGSVFTAPRESARWPLGADHWLPQEQGLSGYAFQGEIGYGYTPMRCI